MPKPILERNKPENEGIGKYILIRTGNLTRDEIDEIRKIEGDDDENVTIPGHTLDTGLIDPFFVIKHQDQFAEVAIKAYAMAVYEFACNLPNHDQRKLDLLQYAREVEAEAEIARHQPKKLPD